MVKVLVWGGGWWMNGVRYEGRVCAVGKVGWVDGFWWMMCGCDEGVSVGTVGCVV
ncbi:hypothetical protein BC829DRAFT_388220 [Chytridium lagenaria]|nr:hypothetical protein BC829DRAFT_388220 [Chytridium lagenaria]